MKHDKVCISGSDLLAEVDTSSGTWWEVLDLEVPQIVKTLYAAKDRRDDVPGELIAAAAAAENAAYDKYAAAWFVVSWPDHVLTPKFNGDASYSCPMAKNEARERADREYIPA